MRAAPNLKVTIESVRHYKKPIWGKQKHYRGVALLLTVLALVAAASIVTAVAYNLSLKTVTVGHKTALTAATDQTQQLLNTTTRMLQTDLLLATQTVLPTEAPRLCDADPPTEITPGEPWDVDSCGMHWTYNPNNTPETPYTHITYPTPNQPYLHLVAFHPGFPELATQEKFLSLQTALPWIYTTTGPFSFETDTKAVQTQLDGNIYAGGPITWVEPSSITHLGGMLASETVIGGNPPQIPGYRYATTNPQNNPDTLKLRNYQQNPITLATMAKNVTQTKTVACSGPEIPKNVVDEHNPAFNTTTKVCLTDGETLTTIDNTQIVLPSSQTAPVFMIQPEGQNNLELFIPTAPYDWDPTQTCDDPCDEPTRIANLDYGTHPTHTDFWLSVGVFNLPSTGTVFSDRTLLIAPCLTNNDPQNNPACTNPPEPEVTNPTFTGSLTFLAGTPTQPANIWIGGPIVTGPENQLGIVATDTVVIPTWAAQNTDLEIMAHLSGLALSETPPFMVTPQNLGDPDNNPNWIQHLQITGSLNGHNLTLAATEIQNVAIVPYPQTNKATTPFFGLGDTLWQPANL